MKRFVFSLFAVLLFSCSNTTHKNTCDSINFKSCGGDIVGKWNLIAGCHSGNPLFDLEIEEPVCLDGGIISSIDVDWQDSYFEFKSDKTFVLYMNPYISPAHYIFQEECLTTLADDEGLTREEYCLEMDEEDEMTCIYSEPECICDMELRNDEGSEQGTYLTENGILTLSRPGENTAEYCVKDDQLIIKWSDEVHYVYEKQTSE